MARKLRQPSVVVGIKLLKRPAQNLAQGIVLSLALALPAHAETVTLPDPSGITLFSLGLAGLILGRRAARNKHRDDEE